ncbi:protein of unknown function [Modestobacter italicus]|uniref:Uncharacterized protein n=1 Tax=Modestobacter italicus (strain DSM 44449 / CECT 9708 / BC 501) TaxID=2732864 RepID=I4F0H8_MODI5|nr:protein of unknown function [Modestobacter marinus]
MRAAHVCASCSHRRSGRRIVQGPRSEATSVTPSDRSRPQAGNLMSPDTSVGLVVGGGIGMRTAVPTGAGRPASIDGVFAAEWLGRLRSPRSSWTTGPPRKTSFRTPSPVCTGTGTASQGPSERAPTSDGRGQRLSLGVASTTYRQVLARTTRRADGLGRGRGAARRATPGGTGRRAGAASQATGGGRPALLVAPRRSRDRRGARHLAGHGEVHHQPSAESGGEGTGAEEGRPVNHIEERLADALAARAELVTDEPPVRATCESATSLRRRPGRRVLMGAVVAPEDRRRRLDR